MNPLKTLQELDFEHKREQYPNTPLHAIARTRFSDRTANGLTHCIIRWLELHGYWATRITTTGRQLKGPTITDVLGRTHQLAGKWIPGTTRKGTADIHAVIDGQHASIEVKIGSDKMSEAQHKTKEAIERSGGIYFVATDFESFHHWYRGFDSHKELTKQAK